jgi:hypothetical protein
MLLFAFLSLCLVLGIFQQSYPISTYEAGISDVLLFCFLSLRLVLKYNSPQFLPMKAGIE